MMKNFNKEWSTTATSKETMKKGSQLFFILLACICLLTMFTSFCGHAHQQVQVQTGSEPAVSPPPPEAAELAEPPAPPTPKEKKCMLWKLETPGGPSYILGSIHFLTEDMHPFHPAIEKAFADTDVLVVEADLSGDKLMGAAALVMKKGFFPGEETLKDHVSASTYEKTVAKLQSLGLDIESLKRFKPWYLSLTITGLDLMKLGYNPNLGVDKYFLDKAEGKKEIRELEGLGFQAELLDSFTDEENESFLLSSLKDITEGKKTLDQMVTSWSTGDVALMEKVVFDPTDDSPAAAAVNKKMMDDRNIKMTEKILTYMKGEKTFLVIVGTAHLVGPQGIIHLLEEKGIHLEQL